MRAAFLLLLALTGCHWLVPHGPPASGEPALDQRGLDPPAPRPERPAAADAARVPDWRADAPTLPQLDRGSADAPMPDLPDLPSSDLKVKKDGLSEPPCVCPANLSCCLESGPCIDTQADPKHCGACHKPCPSGQQCIAGICTGCSAANCSGCCASNGSCVTGSSTSLCAPSGIPGSACGTCASGTDCAIPSCVGGVCSLANKVDGAPCSDLDACTLTDTCQKGVCLGGVAKTCTGFPAIPCQVVKCNKLTGTCGYANDKAGIPCTVDCRVGTTCDNTGKCVGGSVAPDGVLCSAGSCCEGQCCPFACCPGEPGGPCKSICL